MNRLEEWHDLGWKTPTNATPYINWRYREYNRSADKLCNTVMDQEADVFHHTHTPPPTEANIHIFGQSDGGCRYKGSSATGYSIRTSNATDNTTTEITTGGNHINYNMSSLTAETHALDELTDRITQWLQGKSEHYKSTTNTHTTRDQITSQPAPHTIHTTQQPPPHQM